MKVKIALIQMNTVLGDVPANLDQHLDWIEQARSNGADLILFPELSLTGYALQDLVYPVAVDPYSHPVFKKLLNASENLDLMVGFVETDVRGRFYIASAYLSRGVILHVYRKIYLPTYGMFDEKRFFTPGDQVRAFDTRFGRLGMLICEDFWHISAPYLLWMDGADLMLFHAASPGHGLGVGSSLESAAQVSTLLSMYAGLFTSFVAYTNRAGYEDGLYFPGDALVVGPGGAAISQGNVKEGMALVEIDLQQLARMRSRLPVLRDERPELVLRELQRIINKER